MANQASSTIAVFNLKDSGNVAPKRMIAGTPRRSTLRSAWP